MDSPRAEPEDDRPLRRNVDGPVGIKVVSQRVATCQAKRHRSHAADSSSSSQLGTTGSWRNGHAHPSRRIALDVPDALAMLGPSKPPSRLRKALWQAREHMSNFPRTWPRQSLPHVAKRTSVCPSRCAPVSQSLVALQREKGSNGPEDQNRTGTL